MRIDMIQNRPSVAGYYKIEATNFITGEKRVVADWFPNLITDIGLNRIGQGNIHDRCMVGAGSSLPSVLDTSLQTQVAVTTTVQSVTHGTVSTLPYYGWARTTYRFSMGAAAGNLSEVGVGWADNGVFSRSLILDGSGNPTTITILSNEFLDVTYELRCYSPTDDSIFNINLAGQMYVCTVRAANATSDVWSPRFNNAVSLSGSFNTHVYSGVIGPVTGAPSGSSTSVTATTIPYDNNSLTRRGYGVFGLEQANYAGGIQSARFVSRTRSSGYGIGAYQIGFSPAIPKDNTRTFRLDFGISWARR